MNQLPPLVDIFEKINARENLLNDDDVHDLMEQILPHLFEYMKQNISVYNKGNDYKDKIYEYIHDVATDMVEQAFPYDDYIESEIDMIVPIIQNAFYYIIPKRSLKSNYIIDKQTEKMKQKIKSQIDILEEINNTLPEQRTTEWYEMRYNLLSASSIWQALGTQSNQNSLIYDKCKPLNTDKYNYVNINSPFHWGQKYEPVSQMYYEYVYDAEIKEYGCIPHRNKEQCYFLGASPDGINIKYNSERYGRMLEIKNIVNREITGIPKKEYWIQTQLQMECCDLDECDFLECRFIEYGSQEEFDQDGTFQKTATGKFKGIMVQFFHNDKPHYEYAPFYSTKEDFEEWNDRILEKNREKTWVGNIYWKLEEVSCVLIQRNRVWFQEMLPKFNDIWNIIVKERVDGYEHRKPQKRGGSSNANTVNVIKSGQPDRSISLLAHIQKRNAAKKMSEQHNIDEPKENSKITQSEQQISNNKKDTDKKKIVFNFDI